MTARPTDAVIVQQKCCVIQLHHSPYRLLAYPWAHRLTLGLILAPLISLYLTGPNPLRNYRNIINNMGMTKTRKTTLTNTLLTVEVFKAWPLRVLIFTVNTNGTKFITTVNEATKTGCKWVVVFKIVV